jgi:hypothetical protein
VTNSVIVLAYWVGIHILQNKDYMSMEEGVEYRLFNTVNDICASYFRRYLKEEELTRLFASDSTKFEIFQSFAQKR